MNGNPTRPCGICGSKVTRTKKKTQPKYRCEQGHRLQRKQK